VRFWLPKKRTSQDFSVVSLIFMDGSCNRCVEASLVLVASSVAIVVLSVVCFKLWVLTYCRKWMRGGFIL